MGLLQAYSDLTTACRRECESRRPKTAQDHFDRIAAQIGNGRIGRVIMHQGKLYMGSSQYLHDDTRWYS